MTREEFMEKFDFGDKVQYRGDKAVCTIIGFYCDRWTSDVGNHIYQLDWEHYHEPKKKVKKWLWATLQPAKYDHTVKEWYVSDQFMSEEEFLFANKMNLPNQKLKYSEIEMEE